MDKDICYSFISRTRDIYGDGFIPLHRPVFSDDEKQRLVACIDSNFVSSAGAEIEVFEAEIARFTGAAFAIATVNGTAALHVSLHLVGVDEGSEVITQAVSFVATANAISYCKAKPVFIDIEHDTMGMSPEALADFLSANVEMRYGQAYNKTTGARISACVPMHSFGHPVRIDEIADICAKFNIALVEDCAESLGSYVCGTHSGRTGKFGTFSFNGNKIITTGGGGMIITDDEELAKRAKHITSTSKQPHAYEYFHDEVGFNYRMPNLNAAMGLAQLDKLKIFLREKRKIAGLFREFFASTSVDFVWERDSTEANFWLNCILCEDLASRNAFLEHTNEQGVMTRPLWQLLCYLPMYQDCQTDSLTVSSWFAERLVNIPSSVPDI
ncbi:LegC family aminotransferase [Alphaproteobacteria bacterium]|nr:LegC family aminotransferase [Alphaproteobacteria bacterium]